MPLMKILLTGGAGFIGSHLVRQILDETDHEVVNLDKLSYAGSLASLRPVRHNPRYHFEKTDLGDAAAVSDLVRRVRPDAVMHLAAESHVDRSIDGPGEFMRTNIMGTYHLLQAARVHWASMVGEARERFRFLHVSTDEVYGSLGPGEAAFTEAHPYEPRSPYSASKASADHLVRAWGVTYGLPVMVTNCANNYGPCQFPEKLIPRVIVCCLRNEPIPVYGTGEHIRDWLHVSDHCHALRIVLEKGVPGRTYNVGGDCELRNIDLIKKLCAILDELVPPDVSKGGLRSYEDLITHVADRPGHDMRYAMDASRIRAELGWAPVETIDRGLRQTVRWYLEHRDWWQNLMRV